MAHASSSAQAAKVLIVDDVPANLDLLYRTLSPQGYTILAAPNGDAALQAAKSVPDVILLDVMMPGLDGYETCRRLKSNEATRAIPVIFITAQHETASVVEGFRAGGVDYISKPFQAEEVLARVETHLNINRLTRELAARNQVLEAEIARGKGPRTHCRRRTNGSRCCPNAKLNVGVWKVSWARARRWKRFCKTFASFNRRET